jgi:enhancing lycopene biosynthesis protein 2
MIEYKVTIHPPAADYIGADLFYGATKGTKTPHLDQMDIIDHYMGGQVAEARKAGRKLIEERVGPAEIARGQWIESWERMNFADPEPVVFSLVFYLAHEVHDQSITEQRNAANRVEEIGNCCEGGKNQIEKGSKPE